ncbi:ubiquitin carboxyl-terminal hydrolase 40-like [Tubulanus polymorphus]|uniref:ubiquitin carboxyl-terminal hydrolase 40-like n=1 Tax=Tubulanus polymorphus TaxID=672921 RepID=UPI003DA33D60
MFGDLFVEDTAQTAASSAASATSVNHKPTAISTTKLGVEAPPPPRPEHRLCGISNQGATCYLNSLLQTLFMTPEFRAALFNLGPDELGRIEDQRRENNDDRSSKKVRIIPIQIQKLFSRLLLLDQQFTSTTELTDSFGWTNSEELHQHDVQELNRILFSAIEESLYGTSGHDFIKRLYHGTVVNQIICKQCHRISEREEDFLDLTVTVAGMQSLEMSLNNDYVDVETMDGNNQYRCENCQRLVDAERGVKIRKLPSILTISLLRFSFNFEKMERYKETGKFTYPQTIDMRKYCEENISCNEETEYELYSVLIHSGSTHGGHYHAFIRDIQSLANWTHPDDAAAAAVSSKPATATTDLIEFDSPVDLMREILARAAPHPITIDNICSELVKQTGVSWNKRFKKNNGSINKFLRKHDDVFAFESGSNCVRLKNVETNEDERANQQQNRSTSPAPPNGYCWYDFNDTRVQAIQTEQLEKQYSGRESAYMLFYRLRSLGGATSGTDDVPDWLRDEVAECNDQLIQQRAAFEIAANTIDIEILLAENYDVVGGAVQQREGIEPQHLSVKIDQRKRVRELISEIQSILKRPSPGFTVHVAKDTIAGIHLYEQISEDEKCIKEFQLSSNCMVFVWDGQQVAGKFILTGLEHEPILLTVQKSMVNQWSEGYPKSLTLGELRILVCERLLLTYNDCELSALNSFEDKTGQYTILERVNDGFTLDECKLTDLCAINCVDTSEFIQQNDVRNHGNPVPVTDQLITVTVENHCNHTETNSADTTGGTGATGTAAVSSKYPTVFKIQTPEYATVAELKERILFRLNSPSIETRLRIDDDMMGWTAPLHENLSLTHAGIAATTCLILEPGKPPTHNQIIVNISPPPPAGGAATERFSLTMERDMTVDALLKTVLRKLNIESTAWHLRLANWCGEPAAILDDLDAKLSESQMKNGDTVLLEEGRVPPKGYVQLPVWLYPTVKPSTDSTPGLLSWITTGIQDYLYGRSSVEPDLKPCKLGTVEVRKESSVDELKERISLLPAMSEQTYPMFDYLRLRLIETDRLKSVLRCNHQNLQRQKVTSSSEIGVQILQHAEQLSSCELILNVWLRVPGTRTYKVYPEFIWDTSRGTSPNQLVDRIAAHCSLPQQQISIAKYHQHRYEWQKIEKIDFQINKNIKGKRQKIPKVNVKQSPYYIRDGDIIAVKDLTDDPTDEDDFTTIDDDLGRRQLKLQAEEKRKRREARDAAETDSETVIDSSVGVVYGPKREERNLTIKVDRFR